MLSPARQPATCELEGSSASAGCISEVQCVRAQVLLSSWQSQVRQKAKYRLPPVRKWEVGTHGKTGETACLRTPRESPRVLSVLNVGPPSTMAWASATPTGNGTQGGTPYSPSLCCSLSL